MKSMFHRYLWKRLPRQFRRNSLFKITSALAPRLSENTRLQLPYIVVGCFKTSSGLGESARLCHDALKLTGLPVYGIDLTETLNQTVDHFNFEFRDGQSLIGSGTVIAHVNAPMMGMALVALGRSFVRSKRIVGYWAWELEKTPDEWRLGSKLVHEVWVPSHFTARAVAPLLGDKLLKVVPHPVAIRTVPQSKRQGRDFNNTNPFTVLIVANSASSIERKNPLAAIKAFQKAFANDSNTRLILKLSNLNIIPQFERDLRAQISTSKNIELIDNILTESAMNALYQSADVLLSLHRSEGFGLPLAEAMLRGIPVVATHWSGEADFISPDVACPISYDITPAIDGQDTYHMPELHWAEANIDEAASQLVMLMRDPERYGMISRQAVLRANELWSIEQYLQSAGISKQT